jgi:hypothetical protein
VNLSRYWTDSIDWQGDSSGGQSPKGSIVQWSHELSDPARESGSHISFHGSIQPETTYEITINIEGATESALGRYLGCIMIGFMPDEGLEEALFSLRDMLEFYSYKPALRPARLAPKAIDATIADKRKRPDLILTE